MDFLPKRVGKQVVELLENVQNELICQSEFISKFSVYGFGSAFNGRSDWSDVDILIVVDRQDHANYLGERLEYLSANFPLHVTIVLQEEFDELGANSWGVLHELFAYNQLK